MAGAWDGLPDSKISMVFEGSIPSFISRTVRTNEHRSTPAVDRALLTSTGQHGQSATNSESVSHTIFEGTSEIQQLVIARAISGLRIE
jgi:hypothetical protein